MNQQDRQRDFRRNIQSGSGKLSSRSKDIEAADEKFGGKVEAESVVFDGDFSAVERKLRKSDQT